MAAMRSKDQAKTAKAKQKIFLHEQNVNMEMMQMNMRPMMITLAPLIFDNFYLCTYHNFSFHTLLQYLQFH